MITIKTYKKALKVAAKGHQITAQNLLNERLNVDGKGWTNIKLSKELREFIAAEIAQILGGRNSTRDSVKFNIIHERPQHWGLDRIFLNDYGNGPSWSYCAGQSYTDEVAQIRKQIK